jgi:hypothetical protein
MTARIIRSLARHLVMIGAMFAIVGQVSVAVATIAEAREGQGMSSHVEQTGTATHYAHGDSCALCYARSLHGLSSRAAIPVAIYESISTNVIAATLRPVATGYLSLGQSRAPPVLG